MDNKIVTPRYLAQRIMRLAHAGNVPRDSELTEHDVIPLVLDSANTILKATIFEDKSQDTGRGVAPHFIHTYTQIPVKRLKVGGQNFIDLPANYANLPYGMGVYRIVPATDNPYMNEAMIPVQNNEMDVLRPVLGKMQKQWVYYVEGNRAYFYKKCNKTLCESNILYVNASLVVVIGNIADDTPIQCPPEYHEQIVRNVLEVLGVTYGRIDDDLNNNTVDES